MRLSTTPSKVSQVPSGESHSNSVRYCCQINDLLQDGPLQRRQVAQSGRDHTDDASRHSSHGTLQCDGAYPVTDMNQLINLAQRRGQNYGVGRLGGDVTVGSKGDTHRRSHERGGIINSVPDEESMS